MLPEIELPWWIRSWHTLVDKWSSLGYANLTDDEKVWFNVRSLIDETENGGAIAYYYNNAADTLSDLIIALKRLDAVRVLSQVNRVNDFFPDGVPDDIEARNAVIESWAEDGPQYVTLREIDKSLFAEFRSLESTLEDFIRSAGIVS